MITKDFVSDAKTIDETQLMFSGFELEEAMGFDGQNEIIAEVCCENPNIIMESGCETCKSCGWSACLVA